MYDDHVIKAVKELLGVIPTRKIAKVLGISKSFVDCIASGKRKERKDVGKGSSLYTKNPYRYKRVTPKERKRQCKIVSEYLAGGCTLEDLAKKNGVSSQRIQQYKKKWLSYVEEINLRKAEYAYNVKNNICVICKNKLHDKRRTKCSDCARLYNAYGQYRRERLIKEERCPRCGKKRDTRFKSCKKCLEKNTPSRRGTTDYRTWREQYNEHRKDYRAKKKKKGLCILCSRKAAKGRTKCEYHLLKQRLAAKKRRLK